MSEFHHRSVDEKLEPQEKADRRPDPGFVCGRPEARAKEGMDTPGRCPVRRQTQPRIWPDMTANRDSVYSNQTLPMEPKAAPRKRTSLVESM
jgi:hypothetical protein